MQWIDYREKLGIGFSDESKFQMLRNKFMNFINTEVRYGNYSEEAYYDYINMVGESYSDNAFCGLRESIYKSQNMLCLISNFIAFHNTFDRL